MSWKSWIPPVLKIFCCIPDSKRRFCGCISWSYRVYLGCGVHIYIVSMELSPTQCLPTVTRLIVLARFLT